MFSKTVRLAKKETTTWGWYGEQELIRWVGRELEFCEDFRTELFKIPEEAKVVYLTITDQKPNDNLYLKVSTNFQLVVDDFDAVITNAEIEDNYSITHDFADAIDPQEYDVVYSKITGHKMQLHVPMYLYCEYDE